jgi:hypothetical protein
MIANFKEMGQNEIIQQIKRSIKSSELDAGH